VKDRTRNMLEAARMVAEVPFLDEFSEEEQVVEHYACCTALQQLEDADGFCRLKQELRLWFASYFKPNDVLLDPISAFWFGDAVTDTHRQERVLALCFAAAISETEE
jgi:hypothetical protein